MCANMENTVHTQSYTQSCFPILMIVTVMTQGQNNLALSIFLVESQEAQAP